MQRGLELGDLFRAGTTPYGHLSPLSLRKEDAALGPGPAEAEQGQDSGTMSSCALVLISAFLSSSSSHARD